MSTFDSHSRDKRNELVWVAWVSGLVEESLVTDSDEMVRIDRFDVG